MTQVNQSVYNAYRLLSRLIRRLPKQQVQGAKRQLRSEFRKNSNVEEAQIPALLEVSNKHDANWNGYKGCDISNSFSLLCCCCCCCCCCWCWTQMK